MDQFDRLIAFMESPALDLILRGSLVYLAVLWGAVVLWVARDIVNRTNNILFQVGVILVNLVLPVFGLLLYLIIRPSKTLVEKYYEELEYTFLSEQAHHEEHCSHCNTVLAADFLFCPSCAEQVRNSCSSCQHAYLASYVVCPYCGKKPKEKASAKESSSKSRSLRRLRKKSKSPQKQTASKK